MNSKLNDNTVVVADGRQMSAKLDGETVLLNMTEGAYCGLADVGARIWELLQQPISIAEVTKTLTEEYDVDRERCRRDILDFLQTLIAEGLASIDDGTTD